ncbi:MAG: tautomerase family protein [Armatimonadota bacterium]|nr:MAG: tautomerase family protein [Armatimonadota bacterium]
MPLIIFEGPDMDADKKRELVRSFSDATERVTGISREHVTVVIHPNDRDNVGVGGELLSDRMARESG